MEEEKSMPEPLVDIIVAVKNAERYIATALESIAAQTFQDFRIVVVDGRSTDNTLGIARRFPRVTCLQQAGHGYLNAWNTGIAAGTSSFIAFLDSDDRWAPDKLAAQLDVFRQVPNLDSVFGRVQFFREPGDDQPVGFLPEILQGSHAVPFNGSMLVRRPACTQLGPFDERLTIAGDIEWMLRLHDTCRISWVDRVLLFKRLHSGNLGSQAGNDCWKSDLLAIARRRIIRRRNDTVSPNPKPKSSATS